MQQHQSHLHQKMEKYTPENLAQKYLYLSNEQLGWWSSFLTFINPLSAQSAQSLRCPTFARCIMSKMAVMVLIEQMEMHKQLPLCCWAFGAAGECCRFYQQNRGCSFHFSSGIHWGSLIFPIGSNYSREEQPPILGTLNSLGKQLGNGAGCSHEEECVVLCIFRKSLYIKIDYFSY